MMGRDINIAPLLPFKQVLAVLADAVHICVRRPALQCSDLVDTVNPFLVAVAAHLLPEDESVHALLVGGWGGVPLGQRQPDGLMVRREEAGLADSQLDAYGDALDGQ